MENLKFLPVPPADMEEFNLSGKIIFIMPPNNGEEDWDERCNFSCGPQTDRGALYDNAYDPVDDILEKLFSDYPEISIEDSEGQHSCLPKPGQTKAEAYADIRKRLVEAGAVETTIDEIWNRIDENED